MPKSKNLKIQSQLIEDKNNDKFEKIRSFKNDMSQIRYHLKNENLSSTKKAHLDEIELLQQKEKDMLEKLQHTLKRQEDIERATNSPKKIMRAPSLTTEAKFALFQNKMKQENKIGKIKEQESSSFADAVNEKSWKLSEDEREVAKSEPN